MNAKRMVQGLVAIGALGVLAHAGPARACEGHQKTTVTKAEKAQPDKDKAAKQKQQDGQTAKAQQKGDASGAQAKNDAAVARPDSK